MFYILNVIIPLTNNLDFSQEDFFVIVSIVLGFGVTTVVFLYQNPEIVENMMTFLAENQNLLENVVPVAENVVPVAENAVPGGGNVFGNVFGNIFGHIWTGFGHIWTGFGNVFGNIIPNIFQNIWGNGGQRPPAEIPQRFLENLNLNERNLNLLEGFPVENAQAETNPIVAENAQVEIDPIVIEDVELTFVEPSVIENVAPAPLLIEAAPAPLLIEAAPALLLIEAAPVEPALVEPAPLAIENVVLQEQKKIVLEELQRTQCMYFFENLKGQEILKIETESQNQKIKIRFNFHDFLMSLKEVGKERFLEYSGNFGFNLLSDEEKTQMLNHFNVNDNLKFLGNTTPKEKFNEYQFIKAINGRPNNELDSKIYEIYENKIKYRIQKIDNECQNQIQEIHNKYHTLLANQSDSELRQTYRDFKYQKMENDRRILIFKLDKMYDYKKELNDKISNPKYNEMYIEVAKTLYHARIASLESDINLIFQTECQAEKFEELKGKYKYEKKI